MSRTLIVPACTPKLQHTLGALQVSGGHNISYCAYLLDNETSTAPIGSILQLAWSRNMGTRSIATARRLGIPSPPLKKVLKSRVS